MLDRLKQAFNKGPDSAKSPPDATEALAFWRERDPDRNAESTPPETEYIDLNCLRAVELYTPDHISDLIDGFRKLGWEPGDPDDRTDRDPRQLASRAKPLRNAWFLDEPGRPSARYFRGSLRHPNPPGTSSRRRIPRHDRDPFHNTFPGWGWRFASSLKKNFRRCSTGCCENKRRTFTTRTRRGSAIFIHQKIKKHDDVRRIRNEISKSAAAWFQDNLPGEFASGTLYGDIPTCELITLKKCRTIPDCGRTKPKEKRIPEYPRTTGRLQCLAVRKNPEAESQAPPLDEPRAY